MGKVVITSLSVAVAILVFFLFAPAKIKSPVEGLLGGGNLPNRCEFYDQFASRSSKDLVKAGSTRLFSYKVVSAASNQRFFQLHDSASAPATSATVVYAVPLGGAATSASQVTIEENFTVPMEFTSGLGFSISNNFANWASIGGPKVSSYYVSLCYE